MKILVAADSFKGSLTSVEVADAIRRGLLSADPAAEVCCLPVADGGEGTSEILTRALGGDVIHCRAEDPLGRPVNAEYGIAKSGSRTVAIIDVAQAGGLTLIAPEERDIMHSSSYGTGMLIADAVRKGCSEFVIGLGGSATCDAGAGMLAALGFTFYDAGGRIERPAAIHLQQITRVDPPGEMQVQECRFTVLCDVDNPLYGPRGAARIFAPQKGATAEEVEILDSGLRKFADMLQAIRGCDIRRLPGAGAAGGLGAAFCAAFDSRLTGGADAILNILGFDSKVQDADLVITGEGKMDSQTIGGKLPAQVCCRANRAGVPVVALAGVVEDYDKLRQAGFCDIRCINPAGVPVSRAIEKEYAMGRLSQTASEICRQFANRV